MKLYIIRHGQTAWNKEEVFRGTKDIPLNEVGQEEAAALGAYLKDVAFDTLYTSPLSRAVETAQAVGDVAGLAPITEPDLIDLNFGTWQGVSHEKVKKEFPDLYKTWVTTPAQAHFPEGESLNDVLNRVTSLITRLLKKHPEGTVAVFSHRVVCKVLICHLLGLGLDHFWQIEQSTACLNRFRYSAKRDQWICEVINSQCHLEALAGKRTTTDF
ncbi:MAG: histidine phosphatase family protein [Deltaproteobacteria bacterium]|nr:MAG: histidine phosphatase family protein [Deltaproteobacteria bacterium]